MSDTTPAVPAATLTIVEKLEQLGHQALDAVEHAAVWLVGTLSTASTSLNDLEAVSPLVTAALEAGKASAAAHGIPVVAIENGGAAVLAAARQFAAGLSQAAASPPPAAA